MEASLPQNQVLMTGPDGVVRVSFVEDGARRVKKGAVRVIEVVTPELNDAQRRALDAGTNAVLGTLASLTLAAVAGMVGGRIHPRAPQVIYAIMATGTGVYVADKRPVIGSMLASGGMVALSSMVMQGIASALAGRDIPTDPFTVANTVGQAVYEPATTPPPALPDPSASPAPTPVSSRVA